MSHISANLSEEREPSFYWEKVFEKEDAEEALIDVGFVLEFVETLFERYKSAKK